MQHVETEGDTIDQAIEKALKSLGVERDKVSIDILAEEKKGILGFRRQKARIRASLRRAVALEEQGDAEEPLPPDKGKTRGENTKSQAEKGKETLAEILRLMGVNATIDTGMEDTNKEIILNIKGGNGGLLIGRRGQTLEALQYLLTRIVSERQGAEGPQLIVDTENYRERREKTLEDMALRLGEKVKRQRKSLAIDSLSARDRRIVHLTLQDDPWLTTKSLGNGAYRRLLIIPEGDRKK
jgi:spoIIIJ-associated protein